jgi:hypothetical protein
MLAWTLVLGLFFIAQVWARWELPTFETTTFALLGSYLAFKLQTPNSSARWDEAHFSLSPTIR